MLLSNLGVFFLITAEEVHVVIIIGSGLVLGVGGELRTLRAVGSELLGGITREGTELGLVRGDVLVPTGNVGVLLSVRGAGEGLEGYNIGLRRSGAL